MDIFEQFRLARLGFARLVSSEFRRRGHVAHGSNSVHTRKAFIKVKHNGTLNYGVLLTAISKHKHLVPDARVVCAKSVQHNLFRLLYPHMWCSNNQARGGIG